MFITSVMASHFGLLPRAPKISITHFCVGARARACLLIQHATRSSHIGCPLAPSYFSTLSHKLHDFRQKVTEHKMCVLISSTAFI
jgi:hypothetical protein